MSFTNPSPLVRRFTDNTCSECCCPCRSFFGRSTHVTLEFAILPPGTSRIEELTDLELIPNGITTTWHAVADFELDSVTTPTSYGCTYILKWVSPNVKFTGDWRGPYLNAQTAFISRQIDNPGPYDHYYAWHYVFTDTRPLDGGVVAPFDLATYPAWDGAEFDAVQLAILGSPYMTPGGGPVTTPSNSALFPNMAMSSGPWVGVAAPLYPFDPILYTTTNGIPHFGHQWARIGREDTNVVVLGQSPEPRVRLVFKKGTDTYDEVNPPGISTTTDFLGLDSSYSEATVFDATTFVTTITKSALTASPLSRRDDVVFRFRAGDHNGANTSISCGCVPRASGENSLALTVTPARPEDTASAPNYAATTHVLQPDNHVGGFTGPFIDPTTVTNPPPFQTLMSSSWRKLMSLPPYSWSGAFSIGPVSGSRNDMASRCLALFIGGSASGFSHYSESSPLFADFRSGPAFSTTANRDIVWGSAPVRRAAFEAVENVATTNPLYPAGATSSYNPVSQWEAVSGYHGVGARRRDLSFTAGTAFAETIPAGVTPNTTTGYGGNGVWFRQWFDQATPASGNGTPYDGGHEALFMTTKIQSITITSLDTGLKSVWEWSSTVFPGYPIDPQTINYNGTIYSGILYGWNVLWTNTLNQFGAIGSTAIPYGRYEVEVAYYPNSTAVPVGSSKTTNYFVGHDLRISHGRFAFESNPVREWNADWNGFSNTLGLSEI